MITGKDLIEMGFKPGKWFGAAIEYANKNNLSGDSLKKYLIELVPKSVIPHDAPVYYYPNVKAITEDEIQNLAKVHESMTILMKTPTVVNGTIMPDVCPAGEKGQIPVGSVIVTKNAIHPSMHSADICCSVMMTNFGQIPPKDLLDSAHSVTHFGGGGRQDLYTLPKVLFDQIKSNSFLSNQRGLNLAQAHLGTQGDGNHFLFVGKSKISGETVMVTHHGSRGFGANLYNQGMKIAEAYRKEISPDTFPCNAWIPFESEEGKTYWEALQIVREWTKLNHTLIHDATAQKLNINVIDRFWNEHNFVFRDGDLFFHAKGATPLADKFVPDSKNGLRIIPMNMREPVLIVRGSETKTNLGFAPHGAGRNISRNQHRKNLSGLSVEEVFYNETRGLDVRFFSNQIDISELPSAYKDATSVRAQLKEFNLGDIVDEIIPYGCIMAGQWELNLPWRKKTKNTTIK